MWQIKSEEIMEEFDGRPFPYERVFIENEDGVRLIFRGLRGDLEGDLEAFDYIDSDVSLTLIATRVDPRSEKVLDYYTVWLGVALNGAARRLPPDTLTVERVRKIARDIKGAMLVWRLPGKLAEAVGVTSPGTHVSFDMRYGETWRDVVESHRP